MPLLLVKKSAARLHKFDKSDEHVEIEEYLAREKALKKDGSIKDKKPITFEDLKEALTEVGINGYNGGPVAKRPSELLACV